MAVYTLFAGILDYPAQPIAAAVERCCAEIAEEFPDARLHLVAFAEEVTAKNLGQLQENYINAFDLRPDCTLNLGYHLFGDDGRRGLFLAELKDRLKTSGIALGSELPDHISLLLRYMQREELERFALIEECMLPAISRVAEVLDLTGNPYKHAVRALLALLQRQHEISGARADTVEA